VSTAPIDFASPAPKLRIVDPPGEGPAWGDDEGPPPGTDERPELRLGADVHRVCDELDAILGPADPLVYQRAHELVTVAGTLPPKGDAAKLATGTPIVRPLTVSSLLTRVTRHVKCLSLKPPSKRAIAKAEETGEKAEAECRTVQPPPALLSAFLSLPDWRHVRDLRGVTESPLFRPDGTVRQHAGYDEATGYLYRPSTEYPPVPDQPTQSEAAAALAELVDLFCDFPYANEPSRYVPIASILAILARAAIDGPVPAFLFDASVMGSGKTLQCDLAHVIAVGRVPAHANWPNNPEEQEKLLSTYAIGAPQALLLDNVKGTLGGSAIEQTLTSTSVEFRMLGALQLRTLPWYSVIMVSGNNVDLSEDMLRRTLLSRLESPLENPANRTQFKYALPTYAIENRPRLATLALTVLRAFACHGFPDTGVRMGHPYGPFAHVVGGAIRFAGGEDVSLAIAPPERAGLDASAAVRVIVDRWDTVAPAMGGPVSLKFVLDSIYPAPGKNDPPDNHNLMREAFEALSPARGSLGPVANSISKKLGSCVGRWFGDRSLQRSTGHGGVQLWHVMTR
jgi:hypothetical protein